MTNQVSLPGNRCLDALHIRGGVKDSVAGDTSVLLVGDVHDVVNGLRGVLVEEW